MLPASSSVLVLVLLQAPTEPVPPAIDCTGVQRHDLSLAPAAGVEVCVSPGLSTSFRFDAPAEVDVQDDVRFEQLLRARQLLTLVPPPDMTPGERIRLTVRFEEGPARQSATFVLVGHRGRAAQQVEVYHDRRTRESYIQEIEQERAKSQQLSEEVQRLRALLEQSSGLMGLLRSSTLGKEGIPAQQSSTLLGEQHSDDALLLTRVVTYRSNNSVAVELWLKNSGVEPWSVAGASLVNTAGERLEGVRVGQVGPIPPGETLRVFVEADAASGIPRGEVTLRLWSEDGRVITLPQVTFP
ncbi:MAG TPA: DUF2381 family protein [Archangium sp.]|uniref:DUF2381 family protein n=1 Tax=Archangium sp. TaxID=1872627 RepID=UPI002E2EA858|nr:DUF2381 family protein [Archangium sp.]HEX5750763.1 DUF2381 family protein [Archangium sp.]